MGSQDLLRSARCWSIVLLVGGLLVPLAAMAQQMVTTTYTYGYDAAGRLVHVSHEGGQVDYVYDANGNLLERQATPVPEPSLTVGLVAGLAALGLLAARRRPRSRHSRRRSLVGVRLGLASLFAGLPVSAQASAPPDETVVNGTFAIEVLMAPASESDAVDPATAWRPIGELGFDKDYARKTLELPDVPIAAVRVINRDAEAAHIDAVLLDGQPPVAASGTVERDRALALHKLARADFDVIEAHARTLELRFSESEAAEGSKRVLTLTGRIEGTLCPDPFLFPPSNLYKGIQPESEFYTYQMDSARETLRVDGDIREVRGTAPFFAEFAESGSGHPSEYVYGWVRNDDVNLYVAIDFAGDNTIDGHKDYTRVYVHTEDGVREFEVSVPDQRWGHPGFTYTDSVAYQHKVYEFAIPLDEIGRPKEALQLAFAAYGTCSPPCGPPPPPPPPPEPVGFRAYGIGSGMVPADINEFGQVVGICCESLPAESLFAFGFNPPQEGSWIRDDDGDGVNDFLVPLLREAVADLGAPSILCPIGPCGPSAPAGATVFSPRAIDEQANVAGRLKRPGEAVWEAVVARGFVGGVTPLDFGGFGSALDISGLGFVAGHGQADCQSSAGGESQRVSAFVNEDIGWRIRAAAGDPDCVLSTSAVAVNERAGALVYASRFGVPDVAIFDHTPRAEDRAFVDNGGITEVLLGGGDEPVVPTDINDDLFVVGARGFKAVRQAFLYDATRMEYTDLHALLDERIVAGDLQASIATSINDRGEVVGMAERRVETSGGGLAPLYLGFLYLPEPAYGLAAGIHFLSTSTAGVQQLRFPIKITDNGLILGNKWDSSVSTTYVLVPQEYELSPPPVLVSSAPALDFPESGEDGDPVNTFTGDFVERPAPDVDLGGPLPLRFERSYASGLVSAGRVGAMGLGWRHGFEWSLEPDASLVRVTSAHGRMLEFAAVEGGWRMVSDQRDAWQLVEREGGFVLADVLRSRKYVFDAAGTLVRIEDRAGNALTLDHDSGRLVDVRDGRGRSLAFQYHPDGTLATISDGTRSWHFGYDDGQLTRVEDPLVGLLEYAYDPERRGLLVSTRRPRGNVPFIQEFDDENRVARQIDADQQETAYSYDGLRTFVDHAGLYTEVHDHTETGALVAAGPGSISTAISYDSQGFRSGTIDALERTRTADRSEAGPWPEALSSGPDTVSTMYRSVERDGVTFFDPIRRDHPDGTFETFDFDDAGNLLTSMDRGGETSVFTYNAAGQVLTARNARGATASWTYNPDGTVATRRDGASTDGVENVWQFEYDALRRVVRETLPDDSERSWVYDDLDRVIAMSDERDSQRLFDWDANGNLTGRTDREGHWTRLEYDALDRLEKIVDPLDHEIVFGYDGAGRLSSVTDPLLNTDTFRYDPDGRLGSVEDAAGYVHPREYDASGLLERVVSPADANGARAWVRYEYDAQSRITGIFDALGSGARYSHDAMGRIDSITDGLDETTFLRFDEMGLLREIEFPENLLTSFERDEIGSITAIVDGRGERWERVVDPFGRVESTSDPLQNTTAFSFDARHRIAEVRTGEGTIHYVRDPGGRILQQIHSDGTEFRFGYDGNGRLLEGSSVRVEDGQETLQGRVTARYDERGDLVESNGIGVTRDAARRIAALDFGDGRSVSYEYDERGQVVEVRDWMGVAVEMAYDALGRRVGITRANGVATRFDYPQAETTEGETVTSHRLAGIEERTIGETLSRITLDRDAKGQIVSASREASLVPVAPEPLQLGYDRASQVDAFDYDTEGRLLDDGQRTYTWDGASRLVAIGAGAAPRTFRYDPLRRVVGRDRGTRSETYVWNDALELPSISIIRSNAASGERIYIHTPQGELLYSLDAEGRRSFHHYDEAGNTVFLTADDASVTDRYAYTPYGILRGRSGHHPNPFTYQGQRGVLTEGLWSGLYHMRARCYDARTARFLSRDPRHTTPQPLSMSPYLYAYANPLGMSDPTGEEPEQADRFVGSAADSAIQNLGTVTGFATHYGEKFLTGRANEMDLASREMAAAQRLSGKFSSSALERAAQMQRSADSARGYAKPLDKVGTVASQASDALEVYRNWENAERMTAETISIQDANLSTKERQLDAIKELVESKRITPAHGEELLKQVEANFELSMQGAADAHRYGIFANAAVGLKNLATSLFVKSPMVQEGMNTVLPEDPTF